MWKNWKGVSTGGRPAGWQHFFAEEAFEEKLEGRDHWRAAGGMAVLFYAEAGFVAGGGSKANSTTGARPAGIAALFGAEDSGADKRRRKEEEGGLRIRNLATPTAEGGEKSRKTSKKSMKITKNADLGGATQKRMSPSNCT